MVDGISRYLDRATADSISKRDNRWRLEFPTYEEGARHAQRERLRRILGVDKLPEKIRVEIINDGIGDPDAPAIAKGAGYKVYQVRWDCGNGIQAVGLWLVADDPKLNVIAIPDCSITPEQLMGLRPGVPSEAQFA